MIVLRQLIGGSYHGKLVSVPESYRTYALTVGAPLPSLRPEMINTRQDEYRLECINFPDDQPPIYFFVVKGMTPREALDRLLRDSNELTALRSQHVA